MVDKKQQIIYSLGNPNKNTCKDCKDRKVGCHSKCEKYAEFKKELDRQVKANQINKYGQTSERWANYIPRRKGRR